jgi:flagellar hook-basal body complex protein FliE
MVSAIPGISAAMPRLDAVSGPAALSPSASATAAAVPGAGATDFGTVMRQVATEAMDTMRGAESASIQGIKGEASTQAVVEAVMSAERTLQTAVALREKVTNAYLELSRMAI